MNEQLGPARLSLFSCNRATQVRSPVAKGLTMSWSAIRNSLLLVCSLLLPLSVQGQTYTKTENIEYHDNLGKWVLGQPAKLTVNGIVASQTDYDATYALPTRFYSFTLLKQTLTYDTNASLASGQRGTVRTVVDGGNNTTTLGSWYRGIPRAITYADGTSQSAVVNASGWITRVTDENGFATNYAYDPMGRLSRITYPTSDTVAWNPTTISFAKSATGVYGIAAGHWRQIIANGDSRKVTYFDALWRPLVVREYDNTKIAATERFIRYAYDHEGRVTFASYPSASYNPTAGTRTVYDALGRQTLVTQSSELGLLKTTTEYLAGFQTRVTDPRGNQTHYRYLAWDQPTTDFITRIIQPEGAYTYFGRDAFGKPLYITRRTADGSVSVARRYVYGGAGRLCIVTEPETGSTVYGFNGADLLVQTAAGLTLPSGISCRNAKTQAWSSGRRVDRSYDKRNRLTSVIYPDNLGNTSYSYTPDGLLAQVLVDNVGSGLVYNNYIYNKRRLLTGESMDWNNISYGIGYGYSANGHLASHAYPGGVTVAYAPNALGQPTKAGAWATNVSYHPNGAIKQFTYGNGVVHTMTPNSRGLPERIRDAYSGATNPVLPVDESYDYDGNGNVAAISDARTGQRGNRDMVYDGLDRLTRVDSSTLTFGTALYTYDVLDNLRRIKVGSTAMRPARDHTYEYDARNRLSRIVNTTGGATVSSLGYDLQGNITSRAGASYDFDFGNRLRSANQGGTVSSYVYDGHGRRVRDYVGGTKYTQYSRDGTLMFARNVRGTNTNEQYIHLGGRLIAIRSHNRDTGSVVTQYQHTDALGSVVARSSHSRGSVIYSEYEPYGALSNRPNHDRPAYTGHVQDAATGLTYMQQRYYDPVIGRFLSVDPVGVNTGNGANFNRYWYANNNPYKFTDPDGRQTIPLAARIGTDDPQLTQSYLMAEGDLTVSLLTGTDASYVAPTGSGAVQSAVTPAEFSVAGTAVRGVGSLTNSVRGGAAGIANPVPATMARVIPEGVPANTLGRPGAPDVFVTAADDISGMNASQIANRLTIESSPTGFRIFEFQTPQSGVASPVFRTNPGFLGGGRTAGGAREFVLPNMPIPPNATVRTVP
ncbi:polymorphic toxin type 10 domain-containing protein [Luteimonas salinilitoris]